MYLTNAIRDARVTVSAEQVHRAHARSKLSTMGLLVTDRTYLALPDHVWKRILARTHLEREPYKAEHFDCDDFARGLIGLVILNGWSNACGMVLDYAGSHAYNCVVVADGDDTHLIAVEPQTDGWDVAGTDHQHPAMCGQIIL